MPTLPNQEMMLESSLQSIKAAAPLIDWIEIDVALTKDGQVIVAHAHQNLSENCKDAIANSTLRIKDLFAKDIVPADRFPRLEDVLKLASEINPDLGFQIELKQDTNYKNAATCIQTPEQCSILTDDPLSLAVYELVKGKPRDRVIISSFSAGRLQMFAKRGLNTLLVFPLFGSPQHYLSVIKNFGVSYLAVSYEFLAKKKHHEAKSVVQAVHDAGILVELGMPGGSWCMHELPRSAFETAQQLRHALTFKPDIIITNRPLLAMALVTDVLFQMNNLQSHGN